MTISPLSPPAKTAGGVLLLAALAAFMPAVAAAASVSGGVLTVNLDRDALAASFSIDNTPAPSIYLEEFFDGPAAAVRTSAQVLNDDIVPGTGEIPATNLGFSVNGPTVSNLAGRNSQPTTLSFDPANFAGTAAGLVGVGGATRFRIDTGTTSNRALFGDFSLEYNAADANPGTGRSGWTIYNNMYYKVDVYSLFNVATSLGGDTLGLSGQLGLGSAFDHLTGTRDAIVGSFTLQTSVVPVPAAAWLFVSALGGLGLFGKRTRNAGA